jgi:hypothetical protein
MKSTMKQAFLLAAAFAAFLSASSLAADPPSQVGRLSFLSGPVSFHPASSDQWAAAALNYPLTIGDHLWTDNGGRAEIQVSSAAIRLDSLAELSFEGLDDQTVQVRLAQGSLNMKVWDVDPGDVFEVDTPNAQVSLVSNGSYRIDVQPDGETIVTVRQGQAQAETGAGTLSVLAGQQAVVSGLQSLAYYVVAAPMPDNWDWWCSARDATIDNLSALQFVPRGMIGVEDLEGHGTWITASAYGRVWAPTNVPVGWAPYRYGHWTWVEPWGWTWIDDAAWGFAPFHYGRWAQIGGRWCWAPGTGAVRSVYAPALVVFVGGTDQAASNNIGWFPLGPGEVYIPPYLVADSYVVRMNVTVVPRVTAESIRTYQADRVNYANRVDRAVTVVPRQVFVTSRPAAPAAIAVPGQVGRTPVMGTRAPLAPQRESYAGQQVTARPVPQPSAEVMSRRTFTAPGQRQAGGQQEPPAMTRTPSPSVNPQGPSGAMTRTPPQQQVSPQPNTAMRPQQPVVPVNPPANAPGSQGGRTPPAQATPQGPAAGQGEAASLISSVKQTLPGAQQRLAAARKTPRIQYDFNAASQQLAAASASLANADRAYAARNYAVASQEASAAQNQIRSEEDALSAAQRAAGSASDNAPGAGQQPAGQSQGGNQQGGGPQAGGQQQHR